MDTPAPTDDEPRGEIFEGREAFATALVTAMEHCASRGAIEIAWADPDFASWPLARPELLHALTAWVARGRRLSLIASDYGLFPQRFARWVAWRKTWSHAVHCRAVNEELAGKVPTLMLTADLAVRVHDRLHLRGRISREAGEIGACQDLLDALLQRSEESFPVTTLGL